MQITIKAMDLPTKQADRKIKTQNCKINCNYNKVGFFGGSDGKRIHLQCGRPEFDPWVGKIPWRRAWQPLPVFLPGESPGQRSLARL